VYVNTMGRVIETGRRRRRIHSAHFKAEAVGACQQPGVSIAAVAFPEAGQVVKVVRYGVNGVARCDD
jgi:hypothetical protein